MKKRFFPLCVLVLWSGLILRGTESYSELMDRAEKLMAARYERTSRAFKIKSAELDEILDSEATREEKIRRLKAFIGELESSRKTERQNPSSSEKSFPVSSDSLKDIEAAAAKNDPEALYRLGLIYWEGKLLPRSMSRAVRCFKPSAARGYAPSRLMLAVACLNGKGVIPDEKKAFSMFRKLFDEGYAAAGIPLGVLYYEGRGTDKDCAEAEKCFLKGLPEKHRLPVDFAPEAFLGRIYYEGGCGVKQNFAEAVKYLKSAVQDRESQYLLGGLYRDGRGIPRNFPAAFECFRRAAEKGHLHAGIALGRMYHLGQGVSKDDLSAVRWLMPAADREIHEAAMLLAEICLDKKSPARNDADALRYCRIAARHGDREACFRCGRMILSGIGTGKDAQSALEYLRAAAGKGHAEAAFLCGDIELAAGHESRSVAYYRQAADRGHAAAVRKFAVMAVNGQGMKADPGLGIRYLKKLGGQAEISDLEMLAGLYESGIGSVKADLKEAVHYYTAAAQKGSISALARLGSIYHALGRDDKALHFAENAARMKNPEAVLLLAEIRKNSSPGREKANETIRYLKDLADSGDRTAMRKLGMELYAAGDLVQAEKYLNCFEKEGSAEILFLLGDIACRRADGRTDWTRAFRLFSKAAEAGHIAAGVSLGRMYHRGEGVRQDFRRALIFYRQAAEKQDPEGMFLTGLMFYNGEGISPDYAEAYRWFRQAAEKGHALAMQYLSIMFKEGIGVPKNNIEAAKWRRKAAGARP